MEKVWEVYFRDEMYSMPPSDDKIRASKKFIEGVQQDNDCVYKLPQVVLIRENPDDDWEEFEIDTLD